MHASCTTSHYFTDIEMGFWALLQAMHMFRKAESLLETMNKELDKSRVMANRPVAGVIHRTNSISPLSFGVPQTPGAALQPVSRVRHARCLCPSSSVASHNQQTASTGW